MSHVLCGDRLRLVVAHRQPSTNPPFVSIMPSLLTAFQSGCESYISLALFRKPTALLASPTFGRWNHDHMAMRHHMQHNSTAIRTSHTAGIPHNEYDPLTPAEREKIRKLLQQGYPVRRTIFLSGGQYCAQTFGNYYAKMIRVITMRN
jgi:hypothetical protein